MISEPRHSPLLGNVYPHYVLNAWFERQVKPRLRGEATLIRYCDDFVIGFERGDDAERVRTALSKRMGRYGLALHPDKTRLLVFVRPPASRREGKDPNTFDFLGFTFYWRRTRGGQWRVWCKTRCARPRPGMQSVAEWCQCHQHLPVQAQHAALTRRLIGHLTYFGVNGNYRSLALLVRVTERVWLKWLRRRSQRTRLTWERYQRLLVRFPLPQPRLTVRIWGTFP